VDIERRDTTGIFCEIDLERGRERGKERGVHAKENPQV